jgi:hypothetical protein
MTRVTTPSHVLRARLDCDECGETFEGEWPVDVLDIQQLEAAPVDDQTCPACGYVHPETEYPGWTFFGEAG